MPIYMKYGDIKGDVTAAGHLGSLGWVEINAVQFGIARSVQMAVGGGNDRECSMPTVGEIGVAKPTDVSSTAFLEEALQGGGKTVHIDFCKTGKEGPVVYQSFELENAMISSITSHSNQSGTVEHLSIGFSKIIYSFFQHDAKGEVAASPKAGYDLAEARVV